MYSSEVEEKKLIIFYMEEMVQGQEMAQPTEVEITTPVTEAPETPASTTEDSAVEAPVASAEETSEQAPIA